MRKLLAGIGSALVLLAPLHAIAQTTGTEGDTDPDLGSHIQPAGPKPPEPLSRKKFDDGIAKLFKMADTNGDGTITLAELNAVIDARKQVVIGARFAQIDSNHDKSISFDEFSQWQRSLGSAVLSDSAATGNDLAIVPEDIRLDPGRTVIDELLSRMIAPLNATMLVAANTDYDAGVTLAELNAYESKRWDAADTNHDGWLTQDEIGIYLPQARGDGDGVGGPGGFGGRGGGRGGPGGGHGRPRG